MEYLKKMYNEIKNLQKKIDKKIEQYYFFSIISTKFFLFTMVFILQHIKVEN
jgi:hypothetical protein